MSVIGISRRFVKGGGRTRNFPSFHTSALLKAEAHLGGGRWVASGASRQNAGSNTPTQVTGETARQVEEDVGKVRGKDAGLQMGSVLSGEGTN